jgi:hypothetical protein
VCVCVCVCLLFVCIYVCLYVFVDLREAFIILCLVCILVYVLILSFDPNFFYMANKPSLSL